eukprot:TRINITY_DN11094_c1_g1_i5.p1 TRINITY_DN11094_c1_g1~~TRINITY_DN11094_c1_g1_i5.p1  ORF type:complete len:1039 (+),score=369.76 TRINITY_DN11094_c1_g1_i5:240-3119(+)
MQEAYATAAAADPAGLRAVSELFAELVSAGEPEQLAPRQEVPPDASGYVCADVRRLQLAATALVHGEGAAEGDFTQLARRLKDASGLDGEVVCYVPPVKMTARALQKALEDYDGDALRLIDVARLSLVCGSFAGVCGVLRALAAAAAEGEVRVIRGKDRLRKAFPAGVMTNGYRDLVLTLQLPGSTHLAELQVHLRALFDLKSEAHQHYGPARTLHLLDPFLVEFQGDWSESASVAVESGAIRKLHLDCAPGLDVSALCSSLAVSTCVVEHLSVAFADLSGEAAPTLQRLLQCGTCPSLTDIDLSYARGVGAELVGAALRRRDMLRVTASGCPLACTLEELLGDEGGEALSRLDLMDCGLTGPIPPSIARLQSLRTLHLNSNRISGRFPRELCALAALEVLVLNDTALQGSLPPELEQMQALRTLNLRCGYDGTVHRGSWPAALSRLPNLERLLLDNNKFDDELPRGLGELTALRELRLSGCCRSNDVRIPDEWRGLTTLECLHLRRNRLKGRLPPWLSELPKLRELFLDGNLFNGAVPREWAGFQSLRRLGLGNCGMLQGSADKWPCIPGLEHIKLGPNPKMQSHGTLTHWLAGQPQLTSLTVHRANNLFQGDALAAACNLPLLRELSVVQCKLRQVPAELRCPGLERLQLTACLLSGPFPTQLTALAALTELDLSQNGLQGALPEEIGQLSALSSLRLSSNRLSGPLPRSLARLGRLETFCFDDQYTQVEAESEEEGAGIRGPFPEVLFELPGLTELNLAWTGLSGALPERIGALGELRALSLASNSLAAPLPAALAELTQLEQLNLEGNELRCAFPELRAQPRLQSLRIGGNHFGGSVPVAWREELPALTELDVDEQNLGPDAGFLGEMPQLRRLRIIADFALREDIVRRLFGEDRKGFQIEVGGLRSTTRRSGGSSRRDSGQASPGSSMGQSQTFSETARGRSGSPESPTGGGSP